jgi:hypothetical protein
MRVLVVWEPMLLIDWSKPGGMTQSLIHDPRAAQFWDKSHLVATELRQQLSSEQVCCQHSGVIWDVVALYPKDVQWGASVPVFFGGTVLNVADNVRRQLAALESAR